ncbi:inter-alpha-trypsin inhibitor heavy chain H4 isoform X2 [Vulpes lagopus]|uniref:inter-alpha-trypsin inhibitor heavy chain H4 isoform X2 n=1 Tax=Vulpes lagopus TaxID=494514 RepID=UPI001BC994E7|nr:inter-alpha-trypsin inhibitor heavy chain H4 isoform X2 [Vulpes lagopus]
MPNSHLSLTQYMFLSPAKVHGTFTVCLSEATAVFGLEIPISQKPPPEGWDSKHVLIHSPLPLKFRSNLLAPGAKMKASGPGCTCGIMLVLLSLLAVLHATTAQKNDISIYSFTVDSKVSSRFAHTVVTSRVVNRAETVQEATFQVELPKRAFITNFSMIIEGVTYPGNIKEKAAAQEQYSAAVARGESAGLVKATGRKTEQFQVSVNVAPAAKVTFELVYEELLKRQLGVYELLLKVQPQQLVKHLQMDIHIFEPQCISFLETESTFMTSELANALTISQNKTKAHIQFKPQKTAGQLDKVLDGNFIVRYDVNRTLSGGSIQIENGYFVHYFAPEGLPTIPKNVIFVIDKSGSMSGRKIQQTREALIKILDDLKPNDQFNLISFSGDVTYWKPLLVPASPENVDQAKRYAANIEAQGGTNINDAMLTAVRLLQSANQKELLSDGSVSLIILLTDGDPTVGETSPARIQKNVQKAIDGQYSLFCLGFGFDVSYVFLEKLALDNGGLARRIYEDSDSALQLQDFYQEVANPLLTAVTFEYPDNAVDKVSQDNFRLLFKGSEIVVVGKLRDQSPDVLSAKVRGQLHMQNITFQTESSVAEQEKEFQSPKYIFHSFMEKLWAYLTIQQLLEQIISASDAEKQALETRALNLSLSYSFVTPLTSMVVTKPEGEQRSEVAEKPVETSHHSFSRFPPVGDTMHRTGGIYADSVLTERRGYRGQGPPGPSRRIPSDPWRNRLRGPPIAPLHPLYHTPGEPDRMLAPSIPGEALQVEDLRARDVAPARAPAIASDPVTGRLWERKASGNSTDLSQRAKATSSPAPMQAPPVILMLPGQSVNRLCVDIKHSQGPMKLLSDPDQGIEVTGQYETEKAQFSWIEVTLKNLQLQVRASPEHVVVTQNRRNSAYKWKETLFSMMPGLSMTMDKTGLLLLSSTDKVTVGLLPWDGPGEGLRLLLRDTDRFSSHVNGTLGQFYQDVLWGPPTEADDSKRTLRVQGRDYSATRLVKLDYQEGSPGTEISCWSVEL